MEVTTICFAQLIGYRRVFDFETSEAFIEVLRKVYVDARKKSNINIHVINKNRLNGKLKILH